MNKPARPPAPAPMKARSKTERFLNTEMGLLLGDVGLLRVSEDDANLLRLVVDVEDEGDDEMMVVLR